MELTRQRYVRVAACVACVTASLGTTRAFAQGLHDHTEDVPLPYLVQDVGNPGADGLAGLPGEPGEAASAELLGATAGGADVVVWTSGGDGGRGGDGAQGGAGGSADSELSTTTSGIVTSESLASGGYGGAGGDAGSPMHDSGSGGNGGDAEATASTTSTSLVFVRSSADGGAGGDTGASSTTAPSTEAPRGGGGGSATATSVAVATLDGAEAEALAAGGNGGNAYVPEGRGGDGGSASASANANVAAGDRVRVGVSQIGGAGGSGFYAGNGADSHLESAAVGGGATSFLQLFQFAVGGAALTGIGGRAGDASSFLSGENTGGGTLRVETWATGGDAYGSGGLGGDATAGATGLDRFGSTLQVFAGASAGRAWSPDGTSGVASLGPVFGQSTAGGDVYVRGTISGQLAELVDAVDGATSGSLVLSQFVDGGSGALQTASSRLNHFGESADLRVVSEATSAAGSGLILAEQGGSALAEADGTNLTGRSWVDATARAGRGSDVLLGDSLGGDGGSGGDARARAGASGVTPEGDSGQVYALSTALAGDGGSSYEGTTSSAGDGGDAWSESSAAGSPLTESSLDFGEVFASSFALGGAAGSNFLNLETPTARSGDAHASSTAGSTWTHFTSAVSEARAWETYAGDDDSLLALNGDAIASSYARGSLGPERTIARASGAGNIDTLAVASGGFPVFTVEAAVHVAPGAFADYASLATQRAPESGFLPAGGGAIGVAAPDSETLAAWVDDDGSLASEAVASADEVLALGRIVAGSGRSFSGSVTFGIDPIVMNPTDSVFLTFLQPDAFAAGFQSAHLSVFLDDVALLDLSFDDAASVDEILGETVLPLEMSRLPPVFRRFTDLVVALDLESSALNEFFTVDVAVFSTAVDEPQLALLFALVLAAVALARLQENHT